MEFFTKYFDNQKRKEFEESFERIRIALLAEINQKIVGRTYLRKLPSQASCRSG